MNDAILYLSASLALLVALTQEFKPDLEAEGLEQATVVLAVFPIAVGMLVGILNRFNYGIKGKILQAGHDQLVGSMYRYRTRTGLYAGGQHESALEHANTACRVWPKWFKSHARRGAALEALGRHADACEAYEEAASLMETPSDEICEAIVRLEKLLPRVEDVTGTVVKEDLTDPVDDEEDIGEPLEPPQPFVPKDVTIRAAVEREE